jgi:membrane-associated phospholipid phosphatase
MADRETPPKPTAEGGPLGGTPSAAPESEEVRRAGPLLAAGFLALLGCALVFAILADAVRSSETFALDTVGNAFMHGFASPAMDVVMNIASSIGLDIGLFVVAAIAGIILVGRRRHREALFIAVVLAGSILLNSAMKLFFHRARPALPWAVTPPDYSFPSGHAMNSMALGLAITLVVWRLAGPRWGALSLVTALLVAGWIGLSRIYLGVHYPTDVLGGFAMAALWVGIVAGVFRVSTDWRRRWAVRTRTSAR